MDRKGCEADKIRNPKATVKSEDRNPKSEVWSRPEIG
jgi:hypothetical protein